MKNHSLFRHFETSSEIIRLAVMMYARFPLSLRNKARQMRASSNWQWHWGEIFVKFKDKTHYLWQAVGREVAMLESNVTKRRDCKTAL